MMKSPQFHDEPVVTQPQRNKTNILGPNTSLLNQSSTSQHAHGMSVSSHFMSERTINLKKEITSLDEEIIQL